MVQIISFKGGENMYIHACLIPDCGHIWADDIMEDKSESSECPHCHSNIEILNIGELSRDAAESFGLIAGDSPFALAEVNLLNEKPDLRGFIFLRASQIEHAASG